MMLRRGGRYVFFDVIALLATGKKLLHVIGAPRLIDA
jgi:hypothetical protein